jgi:hypothetical protein
MSMLGVDDGLRLDQAPPLSIPARFFMIAPVAMVLAGALLIFDGSGALTMNWAPATLTLTHLLTIGVLLSVMMGALYQMIPVVAGVPVPWVRSAYAVHVLLVVGLMGLLAALYKHQVWAGELAIWALGPAVVTFLVPVAVALWRAPTRDATVVGMKLAVLSLLLVATMGLWMAHGHGGMEFPGPRGTWIAAHASVGLLTWVGGLLAAISWQVVPMFYLAQHTHPRSQKAVLGMLAAGLLGPVVLLTISKITGTAPGGDLALLLSALPAAIAVWMVHPVTTLISLHRRKRKRPEASVLAWQTGMVLALVCGLVAPIALLVGGLTWPLVLGWVAIWGWAGVTMHGMLYRIVPFLVWFHRFSALIGIVPVPPMRRLLPDAWARRLIQLHGLSVALGAVAILSGVDALARITGVAVALVGVGLGALLVRTLLRMPDPIPAGTETMAPPAS